MCYPFSRPQFIEMKLSLLPFQFSLHLKIFRLHNLIFESDFLSENEIFSFQTCSQVDLVKALC